jgi:DNA-binding NarL/FixJ family response regulator
MDLPQIRIILVDDHELVRGSWKLLLKQNLRFSVIAECKNGAEAIDEVQRLAPDIILMDINMFPINGLEATERITQRNPSVKIIGLSINNQPLYAERMLKAGAQGYVTKNSTLQEMTHAIFEVHNGRQYICEEVRDKMSAN